MTIMHLVNSTHSTRDPPARLLLPPGQVRHVAESSQERALGLAGVEGQALQLQVRVLKGLKG